MEKAGHRPHLANPTEAKKRMGKTNKTDALDAKGPAILLHNGTLSESWIPPCDLRDHRELLRTRMALRDLRSSLKHGIQAAVPPRLRKTAAKKNKHSPLDNMRFHTRCVTLLPVQRTGLVAPVTTEAGLRPQTQQGRLRRDGLRLLDDA
jgi:transposase